jgi:hypothetical protein
MHHYQQTDHRDSGLQQSVVDVNQLVADGPVSLHGHLSRLVCISITTLFVIRYRYRLRQDIDIEIPGIFFKLFLDGLMTNHQIKDLQGSDKPTASPQKNDYGDRTLAQPREGHCPIHPTPEKSAKPLT